MPFTSGDLFGAVGARVEVFVRPLRRPPSEVTAAMGAVFSGDRPMINPTRASLLILLAGCASADRPGHDPGTDAVKPDAEAPAQDDALADDPASREDRTRLEDHITQPIGPPPETPTWDGGAEPRRVWRIEADPAAGFHWPYFLVLPEEVRADAPLLVQPNNDARAGASYETHLYWASIIAEQTYVDWARHLDVPCLVPCFPRPADGRGSNLYVHALTRATLTSERDGLERVDLQVLAMIDDARAKLAAADRSTADDVLLWGFSAAGDFVTRLTVLHPERIRACAAGGLGGLPILPFADQWGERLTYPVGVADLETLTGRPLADDALRATPMFLVQGGADENDSVPDEPGQPEDFISDSYSWEQSVWVNTALGQSAVGRVDRVRYLWQAYGMQDFDYRVYPDVEHTTTAEMDADVRAFFLRCMGD